MIPIILSAGRGSRVGEQTKHLPKWFLKVGDRHIYDYQLSALSNHFTEAYVVLGHGFANKNDTMSVIPKRDDINVKTVIYPNWDETENAGTAEYVLDHLPEVDDLLLICGDIIFNNDIMNNVLKKYNFELRPEEFSAVTAFEGIQDEKTAVRWDNQGRITDYGKISGHEEAGIFILHQNHIETASTLWSENRDQWFPIVFPYIKATAISLSRESHFEINTIEDLKNAESELAKTHLH